MKNELIKNWLLLFAASIGLICSSIVLPFYSIGALVVPITTEFGWSRAEFQLVILFSTGAGVITAPIVGSLVDRVGVRRMALSGLVGLAIALALASRSSGDLWMMYLSYSLMAILGAGTIPVTWTRAVTATFFEQRGLALGIMLSGTGICAIVIPQYTVWLVEQFGWRTTAFGSGIMILIIGIPLCNIIRHRPSDSGQFPDGINLDELPKNDTYKPPEGLTVVDFTAKQAFKTRAFWTISLGHGSALLVVGAIMLHLPLHLTSQEIGMSLQEASFIVGAIPAMQIVGHLLGGYLGDRLNKRLIAICCMIGHTLGLSLIHI